MQKKAKFKLFRHSSSLIYIGSILLAIYGTVMIISAEMGETTADLGKISSTTIRQLAYLLAGIICIFFFSKFPLMRMYMPYVWGGYGLICAALIATRAFTPIGGAYGWIRIGSFSIQPSEFAKFYIIYLAARLFEIDNPKKNIKNLKYYVISALVYVFIVFIIENDLGSACVIAGIAYVCILIAPYKEYRKIQNWMMIAMVAVLLVIALLLTPKGTELISMLGDSYKIKRFLASADPFAYQYDSGYHLVMSLVSFATGGLFGLGYNKSIHKYMNFPNPSTDFILPVIVEEMGVVWGLIPILILFGLIVVTLAIYAKRCDYARGKIIIIGTFMYFILHFILNVGGVSGFIPLTGVPLLLVSSGGSSLVSCMSALGMAQNEIININKKKARKNENNSR